MIEEILKENEGKTLEFKESIQSLQGIIKTVVAFANTAGGTIVIGVEDKTKKIIGINNSLAEEERLTNAINDSIAPLLMPDITIQNYRNKELIIVNVPHVTGPCYLKSVGLEKGTYIRLGSTNRVVDHETLQSLKNFARNIYFDELPYLQGKTSDLDWDIIKELFQRVDKKITMHNAESLGLITQQGTKEVPSFGGIILFGTNRLKLFPEAIIRCVRFMADDRDVIIDKTDIEIYLPFALEEAIKFVQRNTSLSAEIKTLTRKDIPQYPLIAIREAIMNAIVHADYAMKGVYISIAIFDARIEITNPGSLPFGFTLEKALAGSSRIRNRVIAKVFYHLKWIEQWGRGLSRIIKECAQRGLEEPKFEELNNQFRVTLYAKQKHKVIFESWQKEFINYLKKKKKISTKEAAIFWKVTSRTARLRLIKLIDAGIVRKTGTSLRDPRSSYVLTNT
jgi:ATP-dependent DNA helicase RecG